MTENRGKADIWIVKLDTSGNIEWQKILGGSDDDFADFIHLASDGGYIIAGYSESTDGDVTGNHGFGDQWIVKLDSDGNIGWQKCLGGSSSDFPHSIQQTTDGGYIVAGNSWSTDGDVTGNHGGGDQWIVKLDSAGNITWQKCLGGSSSDFANSIEQTIDGGYIVAGFSWSTDGDVTGNHGSTDQWIVKLGEIKTGMEVTFRKHFPNITLVPNPIEHKAVMHITDENGSKNIYTLTLFDIAGRKLLERKVLTGSTELSTSDLPTGMHLYQLRLEGSVVGKGKVVISR